MALPPRLEKELQELRAVHAIDVTEEPDLINLVFKGFQLGDGFNVATCELLIRIPRSYPDAGPDMFWTNPEVALANGQSPQSAEHMENYIGRRWRRFSWHKSTWHPPVDNVHGYLEFVQKRLRAKK